MKDSLDGIARLAQKGISLAAQLLELSRPGAVSPPSTEIIGEYVRRAGETVRDALPAGWRVETHVDELPPSALPGALVEQVVVNLALMVADETKPAGLLHIIAARPGASPLSMIGDDYAGAVIIARSELGQTGLTTLGREQDNAGVIPSVVRSIAEETGGGLDVFATPGGGRAYRVRLPLATSLPELPGITPLASDLAGYVTGRSILFARRRGRNARIEQRLQQLGVKLDTVDNLAAALGRIEQHPDLEVIIFDGAFLGHEAGGLLNALRRLCPAAGIVVLGQEWENAASKSVSSVVFVSERADPNRVVAAIVEARGMAGVRSAVPAV
jgi:hypothetical protein